MTHDVCGPGTIGIFKQEFGEDAKVWDREKVVIIPDHYIFTSDERANRNVDILRDFCEEQKIKYFYDIKDLSDFRANPDYKGVCHIALAQEGHCRPGEVLLGTDSHTCNAGAFGQFATGIGNTDAGFVMGTGKALLKVPPTIRFVLDGEMPPYLLAKDLILQIIGEISVSGATYRSMEFVGSTIESLTMEERMTLCNMVIEAGGKNGVVPADETTFKYLEGKTSVEYEPVYSDAQARFYSDYRFDVSKLEPVVAKPHSPDNRALARECKDVKIDRVYIGSCTGGKTEDFIAAAKVFLASGKKVKVPTFLVPATQKVEGLFGVLREMSSVLPLGFVDRLFFGDLRVMYLGAGGNEVDDAERAVDVLEAERQFYGVCQFDVSKLEPVVAKPHSPDNRAPARECKDIKIDRVYNDACTGGKTEDLIAAAKVFSALGKRVRVPTFLLVPATQKVRLDVYSLSIPGSGG
ncbi:3-isopropylmalate dehydratase [Triticum urartu]|uniref:3-isopropylmalate dehydratase n=1 Tax=Triticum urartu TaxID=4572 RepID=M8A0W4_TRIUA|nr:3-isopropylmalate dehydratase [Triticum urartu]